MGLLKDLSGKLARLQAKNGLNQRHIFSLIREIKDLQGEKKALERRITLLGRENSEMNAKLNSLSGLKDAIRALKKKMREEKIAQWRQLRLEDDLLNGNLGYLLKDGVSTYAARVKIEVKALQ